MSDMCLGLKYKYRPTLTLMYIQQSLNPSYQSFSVTLMYVHHTLFFTYSKANQRISMVHARNVKTFVISLWSYVKIKRMYEQLYGIVSTETCNVSTKLSTLLLHRQNYRLLNTSSYEIVSTLIPKAYTIEIIFRVFSKYLLVLLLGNVSTFVHSVNTLIFFGGKVLTKCESYLWVELWNCTYIYCERIYNHTSGWTIQRQ